MMNIRKNLPRAVMALVLLASLAVLSQPVAAQQGGTTRYVYDQNGRLRAVIAPNGEAGVYEYDPAGNFTAIRRLAADALEVLEFTPRQGPVGTQVTLYGVGFGAGVNSVEFNGTAAIIISCNANSILAQVPPGATTGPIRVTTARGSFTTLSPFTVKGIGIIPAFAVLSPGRSYQFQAVISGTTESGLKWGVNDIEGGNSSLGTITPNGLYTAPETLRGANQFFIQAVSAADPTMAGEARVTITDSGVEASSAAVSVKIQVPPTPIIANSFSFAVSVSHDVMPKPPLFVNEFSSGVSVRQSSPIEPLRTEHFSNVSMTKGPVISSVSPNKLARGTSDAITITGLNLAGASDIKFFNEDGQNETGITASNINVNSAGTSLTVTVTVRTDARLGRRAVYVTATAGRTLPNVTISNSIEVTQ